MKNKETLEEAAEKYIKELDVQHYISQEDFVLGAKWQQERSYSKEEVIEINIAYSQYLGRNQGGWVNFKEWFEQFKKK